MSVTGGYTCEVGEHAGIDNDDARTTADVVCHVLADHHARPGTYDIRVGKLGGKILFILSDRASAGERRLFIQSADEVPAAAERLVAALVENKTVAETLGADNVVSSETAPRLERPVVPGAFLGVTGGSALGLASDVAAGVQIDIDFRMRKIGFELQGRAGGVGGGDNVFSWASLGAGGRYYFDDGDFSPFVGGGLMFGRFQVNQPDGSNYNGSGPGLAAEVGASFFRSSRAGFLVSLRADVPLFQLTDNNSTLLINGVPAGATSQYVVPISINFGLLLH